MHKSKLKENICMISRLTIITKRKIYNKIVQLRNEAIGMDGRLDEAVNSEHNEKLKVMLTKLFIIEIN
jgi:hypothetical protein